MVSLYEGDLYLVILLDIDYDFNSFDWFIAKLTEEQVKDINSRFAKKRTTMELILLLIRDQEVITYEQVLKEVGLKVKRV